MVYAALSLVSLLFAGSLQFQFKHHNNDELAQVLQDVNNRCPNITRIYTLSETSVLGLPLYFIEFSTKPGHHEISKSIFYKFSLKFIWGKCDLPSWKKSITAGSISCVISGPWCDLCFPQVSYNMGQRIHLHFINLELCPVVLFATKYFTLRASSILALIKNYDIFYFDFRQRWHFNRRVLDQAPNFLGIFTYYGKYFCREINYRAQMQWRI
jgi:hypothetical protein